MGVGGFFSNMPYEMKNGSHLYGVELDSLTGRIAKAIYPDAEINIQGFEDTRCLYGNEKKKSACSRSETL